MKGDQRLDSISRCHVHRRVLTQRGTRDHDVLRMFDGMAQYHRVAPVTAADRHVEGIVVTVVLDIGEWDLFSLVFVSDIKRKHFDRDDIALVLLGQGFQRVEPAGWRNLVAFQCHR